MTLSALALLVLQVQAQDSLHQRAQHLSAADLVSIARAQPHDVRAAITHSLALAVSASEAAARGGALRAAAHLADAHAIAWQDSFHVRQVQRFTNAPFEWRGTKVRADSLRRAGVEAFGRDGTAAAQLLWRESHRLAASIGDTAAMAAVLHNIGAGFHREVVLDSARAYMLRARGLAARIGDMLAEANAIGALAAVNAEEGRLAEARALHDAAAALRRRIGDDRGAAADYQNIGLIDWDLGQLDEAAANIERALAMNRRAQRHDVAATNLFNLAGLASTAGELARAAELYTEALAIYRAEGLDADAADAVHGLARVEMSRGDYPAALRLVREAVASYRALGPPAYVLDARRDLAATLQAMGEPQAALDELRHATAFADTIGADGAAQGRLVLLRGDLAVQLNRYAEAEQRYVEAERLFRDAQDAGGQAEARQGHALLLLERERWAEAEQVLSDAGRTFEALGQARAAAVTRMLLGSAAYGRGDVDAARTHLDRAAAEFAAMNDRVAYAAALGELAHMEAEAGHPLRADSLYTLALERVHGRLAPGITWELHLGRGLAARARHALGEAADHLYAAAADVEGAGMRLRVPERRTSFRADKWELYTELALTERRRGRVSAAFEASERLRAREMLELLQLGRIAIPAAPSEELAAREQNLRRRIALLAQQLEPQPVMRLLRGPDIAPDAAATRETLARMQQEYADLLLEIRESAPHSAELVTTRPVSWRDVAARLPARAALIEYLASDSGVVVFVITRDTIASLDLGIDRHELARLIEFARAMIERASATRDDRWRAPMRRLHQHLIAPAIDSGLLRDVTQLVIVPHAELHYLPFAALPDQEGRFVVERFVLSFAPSASVWLALGGRPPLRGRGVLALAPYPASLPASAREVAAVRRLMPGSVTVLTAAAASEAAFRRIAGQQRVLHLATNGVLNKHNPLFSFVELASGQGHDGRLDVHEIFGLRLAAELVVLSACETALAAGVVADVPPGDDWVGLTRAFLHAGASNVIATLWSVEDQASARVMEQFYERYARSDAPAAALATAQRRLLRETATAHPFYWAGLVLVGTGH